MNKLLGNANDIYQAYRDKFERSQLIKVESSLDKLINVTIETKPQFSRLYFKTSKKEFYSPTELLRRNQLKSMESSSPLNGIGNIKRTKWKRLIKTQYNRELNTSALNFGLYQENIARFNIRKPILKYSFKNCSAFTQFKPKPRALSIPLKPKLGVIGKQALYVASSCKRRDNSGTNTSTNKTFITGYLN